MFNKKSLKKIVRCHADFNGKSCDSAIFYDWGIIILDNRDIANIHGETEERYVDFAQQNHVKICARCMTPYVIDAGKLVDISDELGPEEVQMILARGSTTLPHVKIKDP